MFITFMSGYALELKFCFYLLYPQHTKYVGVYSFRFSVHPFVCTYVRKFVLLLVRSFVCLSVTGSKFLR